jgi:hypothetical protein
MLGLRIAGVKPRAFGSGVDWALAGTLQLFLPWAAECCYAERDSA